MLRKENEWNSCWRCLCIFPRSSCWSIISKAIKAAKEKGYNTITLAGGVACNSALRDKLTELRKENNIDIKYPSPVLCTDNAAMIGCAGYYSYINGRRDDMSLNAVPNLRIGQK